MKLGRAPATHKAWVMAESSTRGVELVRLRAVSGCRVAFAHGVENLAHDGQDAIDRALHLVDALRQPCAVFNVQYAIDLGMVVDARCTVEVLMRNLVLQVGNHLVDLGFTEMILLFEKSEQQQAVAGGIETPRNPAGKTVQLGEGLVIETRGAMPADGAQTVLDVATRLV